MAAGLDPVVAWAVAVGSALADVVIGLDLVEAEGLAAVATPHLEEAEPVGAAERRASGDASPWLQCIELEMFEWPVVVRGYLDTVLGCQADWVER